MAHATVGAESPAVETAGTSDAGRFSSHIDPAISASAGQAIAGNRSPKAMAPAAAPVIIERKPIRLSPSETEDLIAFLRTLSGPIVETATH